jgi:alcohol dehydrogenase class IV
VTRFEFSTASRIVFGPGAANDLGRLARPLAQHVLVVSGRSPDRPARAIAALEAAGISTSLVVSASEPDTQVVMDGAVEARQAGADCVVGIGGGSAIDAAKAIAAMATNSGDVIDYLEIIGRGRPLEKPSLPCIAIPTTAGTGSEVTRNAVLASRQHGVKVSLRGPGLLPQLAIVDPSLTVDLSPALTATTGLDAVTQLIEAYVSARANPMTDALCREGIGRAATALRRAFRDGTDAEARADMSLASLWSGIALMNAGLGAVHGFAGPIGGLFHAPHGAVCAALLPHVVAANVRAIETRAPAHPARERFTTVARLLTGDPAATAADGVLWLADLVQELRIPGLRHYGVGTEHAAGLVDKAQRASSMKGNPLELTPAELSEALEAAL